MEYENEYIDLPDDPEAAFVILHKRKHKELEDNISDNNWFYERRYVDYMIAFDDVYSLGILTDLHTPPGDDGAFSDFFHRFRRTIEMAVQKILIEDARRAKLDSRQLLVLDTSARSAIHHLIARLREKLNEIALPEEKREALFNKLNSFAAEVDRNRTRPQAFYAFAVEAARAARQVNDEIKPLQETIDRVLDWLDKATSWKEALPSWGDRRKIEAPQKKLPAPQPADDLNDDIPF